MINRRGFLKYISAAAVGVAAGGPVFARRRLTAADIQRMIEAAPAGAEIRIPDGAYVIDRPLTIKDRRVRGDVSFRLIKGCDGTEFKNCTFKDYTGRYGYFLHCIEGSNLRFDTIVVGA